MSFMNLEDTARRILAGACPEAKQIGEGAQRKVYRVGDFVFKVEWDFGIDDEANSLEYFTACILYDNPLPNAFIPAVDIFVFDGESVLVMDYIEGPPASNEPWANEFTKRGFYDSRDYNLICMEDGRYALIDLGCPSAEIWDEYRS